MLFWNAALKDNIPNERFRLFVDFIQYSGNSTEDAGDST